MSPLAMSIKWIIGKHISIWKKYDEVNDLKILRFLKEMDPIIANSLEDLTENRRLKINDLKYVRRLNKKDPIVMKSVKH